MDNLNKKESSFASWVHNLAGPILSLITFVLTFYVDPLNFGQLQPLAAIPAFLLSIIILIITQNINTNYEIRKASIYSDRIYEAVKDYLHVTKVGSPERAMAYINSRIPAIREAKNTSFNIEQTVERAEEKFYESDGYTDTIKLITTYTSKNLIWKDIVDRFGVERCRELTTSANYLANGRPPKYKYKIISHTEPQMNFIILEYTDGNKEVLFNWDYRAIGQDPTVLLSRDKQIVDMFCIHYEYLWMAGSEDHDNSATK